MSKNKAQGTRHESWVRDQLKDLGLYARRLPEGGNYDEGDVEVLIEGVRWVVEAKATQSLNVQKTLAKARRKANVETEGTPVAVVWKRLVKVAGKQLRQPVDGERVVVVIGWQDFCNLLDRDTTPPPESAE
jgi:hypothetical protein